MKQLWNKYRLWLSVLLSIIILLFVGLAVKSWQQPDSTWNVYGINLLLRDEEADELISSFVDQIDEKRKSDFQYDMKLDLNFSIENDQVDDLNQMAVYTAHTAAKEIDFLIGTEGEIGHYIKLGGFYNLSNTLTAKQLNEWREYLVAYSGEASDMGFYAVDFSGLFPTNAENTDEKIIGAIPVNSEHLLVSIEFMGYLFEVIKNK